MIPNKFLIPNKHKRLRMMAFGSSNTQRRIPGMHWFDMLELAYNQSSPPAPGLFLNAGIGGETSRDLLARFEQEVVPFDPDLCLITIGGNDTNPDLGLSEVEFEDNINRLVERLIKLKCTPILQTYYAHDDMIMEQSRSEAFVKYMNIQSELAETKGILIVDQFPKWRKFQAKYREEYNKLMLDAIHLNETGNALMGLNLVKSFDLSIELSLSDVTREAMRLHKLM